MSGKKRPSAKRCVMMAAGIVFIGICVGAYRLSAFGTDPYTCMNLGVSGFLHISFGNWQLVMNALLLIVMFFQARELIGLGTFFNMVCVGYLADLICWLALDVLQIPITLPLRVGILLLGWIFMGLGVSLSMVAGLGVAPYDSLALIFERMAKGRISFQTARILGDAAAVIAGVAFCLPGGNDLWQIIGIGTVCNALFNGPLIQFFKIHVAEPLLKNGD